MVLSSEIRRRITASGVGRPGVERPFALYIMSSKQPERAQLFLLGMDPNPVDLSMHHQSEEERLANDVGQSDSRIVPQQRTDQVRETKLGNSSAGKATTVCQAKRLSSTDNLSRRCSWDRLLFVLQQR